jgi:lipoprotein-releasing system permease protein
MVLGDMSLGSEDGNTIVLGINLADRLGVVVGDTIAIVSPSSATSPLAQLGMPLIRRFRVAGMYETNNKEYDAFFSFVSLRSAQTLFQVGRQIDGIEVRFTSLDRSDAVQGDLRAAWGDRFRILTWYDLHRELYTVMRIERWAAYVILMLIVAVASFNLLGSLTMTVIEKTRDIGVLKAMGTPTAGIQRIFMFQGLYVGIIGTVLGLLLGLIVVWAQQTFHLFPLDSTVYIISAIPVEVRWYDLVVIGVASVGLALLAARSPARRAADLIPVEAIRWE